MSFPGLRSTLTALFISSLTLLLPIANGQTFRGGISGTIADQTGAAVAAAHVTAVNAATQQSYATVSSSVGTFTFQDLRWVSIP